MTRMLAAAVALMVVGCGRPSVPTPPSPASTPPSTTASTTPPATTATTPRPTTAPEVTKPLSIDRFAKSACDSLTAQQVDSLGLAGLQRQSATNLCRWSTGKDTTFDVSFAALMNPLALRYQAANNGLWPVWEPMEIGGLPAVKGQLSVSRMCAVTVATGPKQGIEVIGASPSDDVDWCPKAIQAAEFVVRNLRG